VGLVQQHRLQRHVRARNGADLTVKGLDGLVDQHVVALGGRLLGVSDGGTTEHEHEEERETAHGGSPGDGETLAFYGSFPHR
jgi:hypothetical protein